MRPSWKMERIENWVSQGFPDVFINADGLFHLLELKACKNNSVTIRPHQVSFHSRHKNASSWILVKYQRPADKRAYSLILYHGAQAVDVAMDGLKTPPVFEMTHADDWSGLFDAMTMEASKRNDVLTRLDYATAQQTD